MHSAGLELTKLTYTRLEDNLIRHRGDITWWNAVPYMFPLPYSKYTTFNTWFDSLHPEFCIHTLI